MIQKLKIFLKDLKKNQIAIRNGQQQIWASQKLQTLFKNEVFIPQTSWSLEPETILHILNIISIKKPKNIIEFGGGVTTLYIAKLLKLQNYKTNFISVESDVDWMLTLKNQLCDNDLISFVSQIHAPIETIDSKYSYKNQQTWYSTAAIEEGIKDISHFDLVIVDGPFGGSTPYARFSAMPFLTDYTSIKTTWLLDDTNREYEKEIIREWTEFSKLSCRIFKRYSVLEKNSEFDLSSLKI
ncbi:MAG: hypothetical protein CL526_00905 [Aequorivita sp.]|nr:hypothetical protein [Aequorivita sp.]|tara:strand:+ start:9760 stop:10479 length:720 start_codon:yes stop_codon:yes gene_type:complete